MSALRTNLGPLLVAVLLWLAAAGWPLQAARAAAPTAKISLMVYITTSKACGCTLELCQTGDRLIDQIFTGERATRLERLDYGRDPEAAKGFIMDYRLVTLPALLFLDTQGNLVARWQGVLNKEEILAQLREYGL